MADAYNALLLPPKKSGIDDDFSDSDDDVDQPPPEESEPSAVVYAEGCKAEGAPRCSQWHRACVSHAVEVSISHYGLRPRGARLLAPSLAANSHVQSLDLSDNGLGPEGVCALLGALEGFVGIGRSKQPAAPVLRALSLRQNEAGLEGAQSVAVLLRGSHRLQSLDFAANAIGDKGVSAIADALASNETLRMLCVEHNQIEDDGMGQLAAALKENRTLTSLSIEWNAVGPVGAKALADVLPEQPTLRALNLGWNGLGDQGIASLAAALEAPAEMNELVDMRLHHNRCSSVAALPLARALVTLEMLDVSGNPLGAGGASALLLAQQETRGRPARGASAAGAEAAPRCRVIMEDVCVRPDTALAGLLLRAADAEEISTEDLQQTGVYAAAEVAAAGSKENQGKKLVDSRPPTKGKKIRADTRPEMIPPTAEVKSGKKK